MKRPSIFRTLSFPTDGSCQSFANTIPGTVTGNSDTADYKDAVLSAFPPVSNCGIVKVTKVTNPVGLTGPTGGFVYTLARAGGEDVKFGGPTSITDNLPAHGDSDTFTDIVIGNNFTLAEATQVAPWAYVSTSCVLHGPNGDTSAGPATGFTVVGGVTTECTITNKLETGTITVIKHVINDNGGSAVAGDFTMFLGAGNPTFSGTEAGVTTTLNAGTCLRSHRVEPRWLHGHGRNRSGRHVLRHDGCRRDVHLHRYERRQRSASDYHQACDQRQRADQGCG